MTDSRDDLSKEERKQEARDMNRDPITKAPGAHPVGVGVGTAAGGAAAGAAAGMFFGPIGSLIGVVAGGLVGAAAGKRVAERIDPTAEHEYWREAHRERPYVVERKDKDYDYDRDYAAAYGLGLQAREADLERDWNEGLEGDLGKRWETERGESRLSWDEARPAVRDAWDRSDRTYRTYALVDRYYEIRYAQAEYHDGAFDYDDYRPAYRYGAEASNRYGDRQWDDELERDLERNWESRRGKSRLTWDKARAAVRDAFSSREDYNSYASPDYSRHSDYRAGDEGTVRDPLKVGSGIDPTR